MTIVGIICEYNPFHRGHRKQFSEIRQRFGADAAIVCLMSGNYVQRGAPAVFDREVRARAAILSGADLVLELPVTASLSSAEGFASAGVAILSPLCDYLCFGTESGNSDALMRTAQALLSPAFRSSCGSGSPRASAFPPQGSRLWRPWAFRAPFWSSPTTFWPRNTARPFSPRAVLFSPSP